MHVLTFARELLDVKGDHTQTLKFCLAYEKRRTRLPWRNTLKSAQPSATEPAPCDAVRKLQYTAGLDVQYEPTKNNSPTNQKGYGDSEATVGKLSARRIQI